MIIRNIHKINRKYNFVLNGLGNISRKRLAFAPPFPMTNPISNGGFMMHWDPTGNWECGVRRVIHLFDPGLHFVIQSYNYIQRISKNQIKSSQSQSIWLYETSIFDWKYTKNSGFEQLKSTQLDSIFRICYRYLSVTVQQACNLSLRYSHYSWKSFLQSIWNCKQPKALS